MIPRAGHPDQQSSYETRRLWSLWEMMNFRFGAAHRLITNLTTLVSVSSNNMKFVSAAGGYQSPLVLQEKGEEAMADCIQEAKTLGKRASETTRYLRSSHINNAAARLQDWANDDDHEWAELNTRSRALRDAIDIELREHYYYQYQKNKAQKVLSWEEDWKAAIAAFPDCKIDVFCAIDCYGLEHNTAAVFHSMRVLERGLSRLAAEVDLSFDRQQWNTIIEQIEAEIRKLRSIPSSAEKSERLQFLSEAAKEFFYFKDGWRNYVSHNRGIYDEHQAAGVLEHTRAFMNHLATHLSE
jgi:hypothetical protein